MSTMNNNTRIAATRCSVGTWFVSISVDILHKGDTEDNNNNNLIHMFQLHALITHISFLGSEMRKSLYISNIIHNLMYCIDSGLNCKHCCRLIQVDLINK